MIVKLVCNYCKTTFYKSRKTKYCSRQCLYNSMKTSIFVNCLNCQKEFSVHPHRFKLKRGRYCSRECYLKSRTDSRVKRVCKNCNQNFFIYPLSKIGKGKYCSQKCAVEAKIDKLDKTCLQCGEAFKIHSYKEKYGFGKFCSIGCFSIHRKDRVEKTCKNCGKSFEDHKNGVKKYCSKECFWDYHSGENHHCWIDGNYVRNYPREFNIKFKHKVRKRDEYKCKICGKRKAYDVHHIDYNKQNTTPENCITLCKSCHAKTNNNREYWSSFCQELLLY